jgi:hypothetical protein
MIPEENSVSILFFNNGLKLQEIESTLDVANMPPTGAPDLPWVTD